MKKLKLLCVFIFLVKANVQTADFPFPTAVTYTVGMIKPGNFKQTQFRKIENREQNHHTIN
jgi:hypothetical protein